MNYDKAQSLTYALCEVVDNEKISGYARGVIVKTTFKVVCDLVGETIARRILAERCRHDSSAPDVIALIDK
mgnify:CR=1 FL=1